MKLEFLKSLPKYTTQMRNPPIYIPRFPQMLQFPLWRKYGTNTQYSEMLCRACTNRNMHKLKVEAPQIRLKKHHRKISLNSLVLESLR